MADDLDHSLNRRQVLQLAAAAGAASALPIVVGEATVSPANAAYNCPPALTVNDAKLPKLAQVTHALMADKNERKEFNTTPTGVLSSLTVPQKKAFLSFTPNEIVWQAFSELKTQSPQPTQATWQQFFNWSSNALTFLDCWPTDDVYEDQAQCQHEELPPQYAGPRLHVFRTAKGVTLLDQASKTYEVMLHAEGAIGPVKVTFSSGNTTTDATSATVLAGTFRCSKIKAIVQLDPDTTYQATVVLTDLGITLNGVSEVKTPA